MTLRIRPATPEDAPTLAALSRELNEHLGEPTAHLTAEAALAHGFGADPAWEALIAERDDAAIGYALFHEAYETAYAARGLYICDIHIVAAARRQGVGRALVAAVAAAAKARGLTFLWWVTKPWNEAARAFYRSFATVEEPVVAYALTFDAFERLAREGASSEPRASWD